MSPGIERELNTYFDQIQLLFPVYTRKEKRFLREFQTQVRNYVQKNGDCSMEIIESQFGDPLSVVSGYLDVMDEEVLLRRPSARKLVLRLIVITALLIAALFLARHAFINISTYLDEHTHVTVQNPVYLNPESAKGANQ